MFEGGRSREESGRKYKEIRDISFKG
jgi:hypothetical protein